MQEKILLVEDDKRMNELVSDYLEMAGYSVECAFNGNEGLEMFEAEHFDCVILDIMMPGLDGWSLCRRIRKKSDVIIVLLTARSDEDDKLLGFELGADDYVTKPFSPKVLVAKVSALLNRFHKNSSSADTFTDGPLKIDFKSMEVFAEGIQLTLTGKEFNLLSTMAREPGRVFSREYLINNIWGYEYIGDGRVVDTNIKTLRKKLGDCSVCITTVIGAGYKYHGMEGDK